MNIKKLFVPRKGKAEFTSAVKPFLDSINKLTAKIFALAKRFA